MNLYWVEHMAGGRAQAWCDVVGPSEKVETTYRVGSPAPIETVTAAVDELNSRASRSLAAGRGLTPED